MAFFRKWKAHYRHKKFKSEEDIGEEDWGLSQNRTSGDACAIEALQLGIDPLADGNGLPKASDDEKTLWAKYNLKYLGCTAIEQKRSEKIVADAIKTVIGNSKAGGRAAKSQRRVNLNVLQDGIEVLDQSTQETIMRFSIYDISYCSVDAAHDHAFAFVGAERSPLSEEERLSCHVFQCPKRKVAHDITLTVARCFENAYQNWRDAVVRNMRTNPEPSLDAGNHSEVQPIEVHQRWSEGGQKDTLSACFSSDVADGQLKQNNWISFDEDGQLQRIGGN